MEGLMSDDLSYLYFRYVSDPSEENLDRLLRACLKYLHKQVRYFVYCKRICPSFMGSDTFADDAYSLCEEKFWRGLHGPRPLKKFVAWLNKVALSSVVQEHRSRVRRTGDGPLHFIPPESEVYPDGD
jgi:DNA-directed RNA polymerase specialized sigma24 family protein